MTDRSPMPSALIALALLAGCSGAPPAQPTAQQGSVDPVQATQAPGSGGDEPKIDAPIATDAWVGRWVGVEGLALDIARGPTPGTYVLSVTLMDGTRRYEGTAMGDRIQFVRDGKTETIRKAIGAETGLKWLADKADCLMIRQGEGFCRG